jgi:alkaline phosphatase
MRTVNRYFRGIIRIVIFLTLAAASVTPAEARKKASQEPARVKYVFFMISDGMGINQAYGANLFNSANGISDAPLNFTTFQTKGIITTHCANSLVTDSAAAGTALATGAKTNSGSLGVDTEGQPLTDLTELAKAAGYGTGVITSVGVNHATPGAFYAHARNRNEYDRIARQLIASDVDFAAGGGFNYERKKPFRPADYAQAAREAGIGVYVGKDEISNIDKSRRALLLGSLETNELALAIDRRSGDETALADFTSAAIDYLYSNYPQGFFLMVEGGLVDHAAHNNDAASDFYEINDFAASVDLVLDFCREHPDEAVVVVTADHDTGGLALGAGKYEVHPERLAGQKESKNALTAKFDALKSSGREVSWEEVRDLLSESLGLWSEVEVSEEQEARFKQLYEDIFINKEDSLEKNWYATNSRLVSEAVDYLDRKADLKYGFSSHSGAPVGLFVSGARADEFRVCSDNTDIPEVVRKIAKY